MPNNATPDETAREAEIEFWLVPRMAMPRVRPLPPPRLDTPEEAFDLVERRAAHPAAVAYDKASANRSDELACGRAYRHNSRLRLEALRAEGLREPARPVAVTEEAREGRANARARMEEDRDLVRRRLSSEGLTYPAQMVMGRAREAVVVRDLRSGLSPNLAMFVESVPKRGLLEAGWSKDGVRRRHAGRYKILALDLPYVRFCGTMWRIIRVDLDTDFPSADDLKRRLVDLGLGVCLPHYVTWDDHGDGVVRHPHVGWILPAESAVWNDASDARCRHSPRRLFRRVHAAIVDRLRPVGADPGCLVQAHHGKNPISPYLEAIADWNESRYPDLTQWRDMRHPDGDLLLDLSRSPHAVVRSSVASLAGMVESESNAAYTRAWAIAGDLLRGWRDDADPRYAAGVHDRLVMAEALAEALSPDFDPCGDLKASGVILRSACRRVAESWRVIPLNLDRNVVERGAASHTIDRSMPTSTRQAKGGVFAASRRAEATRSKLSEAAAVLRAEGIERPSAKALAGRSGVPLSTVYRRIAEVVLPAPSPDGMISRERYNILAPYHTLNEKAASKHRRGCPDRLRVGLARDLRQPGNAP